MGLGPVGGGLGSDPNSLTWEEILEPLMNQSCSGPQCSETRMTVHLVSPSGPIHCHVSHLITALPSARHQKGATHPRAQSI